jgi:hypothetical protein
MFCFGREGVPMDLLLIVLVYVGVCTVAIAVSTVVLGASLFLVEDVNASSFRINGQAVTWGKCAGIVTVTTLVGLLPFGWVLALIAYFIGVMWLFQKTFLQALLLLVVNGLFSMGVSWVIVWMLAGLLGCD